MEQWKTVSRRTILNHDKFLTVEAHQVQLPSGQLIDDWSWVKTPDFVNVVAVTEQGEFLCFRQVKYGIEGTSLAPVGGYIEPGEEPMAAAKRELMEETGCLASRWTSLGDYLMDPNRGFARGHMYLAEGARAVVEPDADDLEEQLLMRISRQEMEAGLNAGEFKVVPWSLAVALALRRLDQNGRV